MKKAIYPGSFDPCTLGHLDIIKRAANMVDELIVGVLVNKAKTPLFSSDYRVSMLKEVTKDIPNVRVESFEGLTADFAGKTGANIIVRGLRIVTDFEFELQVAQTNRMLNQELETIFLTTSLEYSYLSSTTVRETAAFGGDISRFVPSELVDAINDRVKEKLEGEDNEQQN